MYLTKRHSFYQFSIFAAFPVLFFASVFGSFLGCCFSCAEEMGLFLSRPNFFLAALLCCSFPLLIFFFAGFRVGQGFCVLLMALRGYISACFLPAFYAQSFCVAYLLRDFLILIAAYLAIFYRIQHKLAADGFSVLIPVCLIGGCSLLGFVLQFFFYL